MIRFLADCTSFRARHGVNRQQSQEEESEHISEPQPEQTPQVVLETSSNGNLTAASKSACSVLISLPSFLRRWSSPLFEKIVISKNRYPLLVRYQVVPKFRAGGEE